MQNQQRNPKAYNVKQLTKLVMQKQTGGGIIINAGGCIRIAQITEYLSVNPGENWILVKPKEKNEAKPGSIRSQIKRILRRIL